MKIHTNEYSQNENSEYSAVFCEHEVGYFVLFKLNATLKKCQMKFIEVLDDSGAAFWKSDDDCLKTSASSLYLYK